MSVIKMPYNNEKIGNLKQMLVNAASLNKPKDYEIKVDEMKVVPRTNDPEQFDSHEESIMVDTASVTIILYDGASRNNTKYLFLLKDEPKKAESKGLSGIEMDKMLNEKITQERKQWGHELLEKENQELKTKLTEADDYIDKLTESIDGLRTKRKTEDIKWGNIAGIAAETIIRNNVHLLARIPGAEGLAGIIFDDNRSKELGTTEELQGEASFAKSNPEEAKKNEIIDEDDRRRLGFLKELEDTFDESGLNEVIEILNLLTKKPQSIKPTKIFIQKFGESVSQEKKHPNEKAHEPKGEINNDCKELEENNSALTTEIIESAEDEIPQSPIS